MSTTNGIKWDRVEAVMRRIFSDPRHHDQATWLNLDFTIPKSTESIRKSVIAKIDSDPACGTTACMAGWAGLMFHENWKVHSYGEPQPVDESGYGMSWPSVGRAVFGINQRTSEQWFLDATDRYRLLDNVNFTRRHAGLPEWTAEFLATEPTNAPVR